ncbi:DnaB-like helicase C-terminal domain-containing protein [Cloacibacillus sp. An23]|uniref:DnaB-like helicase C-terminal domain-containing protein n=1 Tax=Cloacibacillus sp. An23 TaxID=1965591 RepID=UPI000B38EEDE|nr:DnaB-like helicase C-terminal domain-containing protein [Cloacibacillus sp. An23]OUO91842.1 hypothetical protein B5F39_11960 [Cloacibacillus sp. An23]
MAEKLAKFIELARRDSPDDWEDGVIQLLAVEAEDVITRGMNPMSVGKHLAKLCSDGGGNVLVSGAVIRRAVAEGFRSLKASRFPSHGDDVMLSSESDGISLVPSTSGQHLAKLTSEVAEWKNLEGYGFGVVELDRAYGGLYPGEMMALVGAPGSMKTSLALNAVDDFMYQMPLDSRLLFFSLDMPPQTVIARRLMREMNCFQSELYRMVHDKHPAVKEAYGRILERDAGRFRLIGRPRGGEPYSWDQAANIIIQVAPDLVIIDYLTLIGKYRSELEAVYDLVPKIVSLKEDLGIAVILLSQMGRSSKAAQKSGSGGHAAGGHYVEDAADVEIELLKDESEGGETAIVATVTKTRKNASGKSFRLDLNARSLSFGGTAERVKRLKQAASVFNI